ncbi:unnamed protein product [Psylliodes chrysocephalus]|uniref:Globin domain-containing protein n=1 Tax=Psylliodes chrysocephalus TaxID=3402493 RepID=A0A9P0CSF6_9CUCU|nr:unnamed protein product [Psylliodes chrysocephala]
MGGKVSSFYVDKGRTDDPDPITGLTTRDKYLIDTTWNTVMEDATGNGVTFFMRLFEINPKHKQVFPFRDQPIKDLPSDRKFHAHVTSVMYSISSIVKSMDDPEVMIGIINKIGKNHAKRSVNRQALIDVKQALLDTFGFMAKEEIQSWIKFLDYFIEEGTKALEEYSLE